MFSVMELVRQAKEQVENLTPSEVAGELANGSGVLVDVREPTETAYEIERRFDAKAGSVFRAVAEPELIKRWWGFPDSQWLDCQVDLRAGGYWRNSVRDDGSEV